jgi:hypothetical protein
MPPPSNGDIQASNTSCRTTSHTGYVRMPRATRSLAELSDSTNERDKALARGDATAAQVTHYRNQLCENGDSSSSTLDVTQCTSHSNSNSTVEWAMSTLTGWQTAIRIRFDWLHSPSRTGKSPASILGQSSFYAFWIHNTIHTTLIHCNPDTQWERHRGALEIKGFHF